ncbi:MAG: hypothetical protein LBB88_00180 [Planctomycetaceae bacterium]|nr:hypothetical protein [Planctomycetaceae bacterium]
MNGYKILFSKLATFQQQIAYSLSPTCSQHNHNSYNPPDHKNNYAYILPNFEVL